MNIQAFLRELSCSTCSLLQEDELNHLKSMESVQKYTLEIWLLEIQALGAFSYKKN